MRPGTLKPVVAVAAGLLALVAVAASAEDLIGADTTAPPPRGEENTPALLSGTLQKVRDAGVITLGYRDASFPFSYVRPGAAAPLGYSIDLCLGVVDEVVRELNGAPIRTAYKPVTSDSRIAAVTSGAVDLECGSTTSNLERQKSVAFSPIIYVAGTKLLVKRGSGIQSYRDLAGKTLVVTSGTTNEAAMRFLNDKYRLGIAIQSARDHEDSFSLLAAGKVDGFATDDVLLYGFVIAKHATDMAVVGDFITYEPYGIMFRKDDPLMEAAVRRAFETMAKSRTLASLYRKWFLERTPTGELLDLPLSVQLAETFRALGAEEF
ncbi:MAG: amino acid ABC transporter substrate-binding protein [Alphaproteobacteria bacterium]|nr:amino acid ABC transporter substrate-binding protein [Alphaproteobacteria bacterium]